MTGEKRGGILYNYYNYPKRDIHPREEQVMKILYVMLVAILIAGCGPSAEEMTATAMIAQAQTQTAAPTKTPTMTPTMTLTPTKTLTPTNTPNLTATRQYDEFFSLVQTIYDAGQISTIEGTYKKLDDFSDQLAQKFGYRWAGTGIKAKNFIIRADFDWSVANQDHYSGCGYVFREKSKDFYYMIALDALDGVLLSYTKKNSSWWPPILNHSIGAGRRTKLPGMGSNPYRATFTLVVNEFKAYAYINGNFHSDYELQKNWLTETGPLSFMILAGTDKDFGTRCEITNAEVWIINK